MKRKIVLVATCASLALMTAACGNKADTNKTEAETTVEASVESEADDETDEALDADTEASDYYTKTPVQSFGTIQSVDAETGSISVNTIVKGEAEDGSEDSTEEIIFNSIAGVPIIDAFTGLPVELDELESGSNVFVWGGDAMTMSLPAQTNLQAMIVNIPADAPAPTYVVVKGLEWSKDDTDVTITDQDGNVWHADSAAHVSPYTTKQIVRLEDITSGSRLFVWPSSEPDASEGDVTKIVLMNE